MRNSSHTVTESFFPLMKPTLNPNEIRVLGCLIEKAITTPDYYPLSINALTSAANQKSNRDPVVTLTETEVQQAIDSLTRQTLVRRDSSAGGRVDRYAHRIDDRLFGELQFAADELAIICLLFLRGPQTAGELRTRSGRLFAFADITAVEGCLARLAQREDGPYVAPMEREPGRREIRHRHLFDGTQAASPTASIAHTNADESARPTPEEVNDEASPAPQEPTVTAPHELEQRVAVLEQKVEDLTALVDELIGRVD